jgi:hypothetical protein
MNIEHLNSLKIYKYDNKVRLGQNCDGGYVIAETDGIYDCYISAGVSNEESFSRDFINKYNMNCTNSFAFDGTIRKYPTQYTKNITFYKRNISTYKDSENSTLEYFIDKYNDIFLKIDIEGGEYPWLNILTLEQLSKFKQIVIEFHGINNDTFNIKLEDKIKCFEKLSETHYPIHAHGNNCGELTNRIPNTIEITYLRKNLFTSIPLLNEKKFPHENLDFPNNPNYPDLILDYFPFINNS